MKRRRGGERRGEGEREGERLCCISVLIGVNLVDDVSMDCRGL